jgi:hypothetical protein
MTAGFIPPFSYPRFNIQVRKTHRWIANPVKAPLFQHHCWRVFAADFQRFLSHFRDWASEHYPSYRFNILKDYNKLTFLSNQNVSNDEYRRNLYIEAQKY